MVIARLPSIYIVGLHPHKKAIVSESSRGHVRSSMVGRRGRPPKRKVEELQEDGQTGKSKTAKEARIESISLDATEPSHMAIMTLVPEDWLHQDSSEQWSNDRTASVSEAEEAETGGISQGTSWRGDEGQPPSQVTLSCKRVSNGQVFDCETQTFHFTPVSPPRVVVVPEDTSVRDTSTAETIKVEIDPDQEEFFSHPLVCSVRGCGTRSDTGPNPIFYTVPKTEEKLFWDETLDIIPLVDMSARQHVCSKHFITPTQLPTAKSRTRKKKTCDMLVAEEAEKIKQGLSSGRPKRTPKPNKNYDWAEIAPLIKSEPDDMDDEAFMTPTRSLERSLGSDSRLRKSVFSLVKEDKENERPLSDTDGEMAKMVAKREEFEDDDDEMEEEEEDMENISLPSHPRQPPPKPKGRPHRIRDSCTQTESAYSPARPQLPLREVKVQCNLNSEPLTPCASCSYVNWVRLEELIVDCASKTEGDLCVPLLQECLRKVVDNTAHPTHASNVLKLLSGSKRDVLESSSDIVLVPEQEDEVEIENVIHPEVDEPITGLREITPKSWQKKMKWKKTLAEVETERMDEEDLDGLGLQEATELDDEEFQPSYLEVDDSEEDEEDDQGLDDEDWTITKQDSDSRSSAKKKQKKTQQLPRVKKGRECPEGETEGREAEVRESGSEDSQEELGHLHNGRVEKPEICISRKGLLKIHGYSTLRQRRLLRRARVENDDRWLRGSFNCPKCEQVFSTRLKMEHHHQHVHMGVPPWKGSHLCEECGKTFTQKVGLRVHRMHKHGDPKQFPCHMCSYEGATKAKLARHLKSHSDERFYTCEVCGASLKTTDTYKNHMALHTNQGRYQCSICKKAFNHKQYYDDHYRSHFSLREYNCDLCHTSFKTSKSLRTHIRAVHLNDKRMVCPVCGARFMTNFNLRGHMKKHARPEPTHSRHQCNICLIKFHTYSELHSHRLQLHPGDYQSIQIKVEPMDSASSATLVYGRVESDPRQQEYLVEGQVMCSSDTIEEEQRGDTSGCEALGYESESSLVIRRESVEAVEGIEAVEVEQPKQQFTVIYVYDCSECGNIFPSAALLNNHIHTAHKT